MKLEYPPGATPLDPEALAQLQVPATTQGQLNEYEAQNIIRAEGWAGTSRLLRDGLLSREGLLTLHRRMFEDVWGWAGDIRRRETNIGIDPLLIEGAIQQLCGNFEYRIENESDPWPDLAVEFHHELVRIHPFYNGNGRHARLAADLMLVRNGHERLPWGGTDLTSGSTKRDEYIAALQEADQGHVERLKRFAVSR